MRIELMTTRGRPDLVDNEPRAGGNLLAELEVLGHDLALVKLMVPRKKLALQPLTADAGSMSPSFVSENGFTSPTDEP